MTMRDPSEVIAACPFCGNDVQEDEGCFQSGGFRSPSTPVFVVRCGNPECNAETAATNAADAIAAWNRRALPASAPPGDACVRHACKRVRMEMQAEVDRLRGLLRRWFALDSERDDALRGETAAEVKGDSHAG